MEAKKRNSWELLAQIALSKSKTAEFLSFLAKRAPTGPRRLKRLRNQLGRTLPPEELLSETIVDMREERI